MTMENIIMVLFSIILVMFVFGIILAMIGKEFIELNTVIYNLKEKVRELEMQQRK